MLHRARLLRAPRVTTFIGETSGIANNPLTRSNTASRFARYVAGGGQVAMLDNSVLLFMQQQIDRAQYRRTGLLFLLLSSGELGAEW